MTRSTNARCSISSRCAGPQYSACQRKFRFIFSTRPVIRLSSVDMPRNSAMFWKVRATPLAAAKCGSMAGSLRPLNVIDPERGL